MTALRDEALPTLDRALSVEAIAAAATASEQGHGLSAASNCQIELIKHVPGQRATVLYTLALQTEAPKRIIGKLYRSARRAARMHRWLGELNSSAFPPDGVLRVPRPLGLADDFRMVLHDYIDGSDLRYALEREDHEPITLAAQWLARLHGLPPLDDLKVRGVEHEFAKARRWLDRVRDSVSPELQQRLNGAHHTLTGIQAHPPAIEPCIIHRDFYYANLLWDGKQLWAIDLDQLCMGDPALDVAHFLSHLQVLAYRKVGDFTAYNTQAERFLAVYHEERPDPELDERLPMYLSYTFVKLAATEMQRARPGWRAEAEALAAKACDALEQPAQR